MLHSDRILSRTALRGSPCPCVELVASPWVKKSSEIYFPAPTCASHPDCQFLHNLRTFQCQLLCPIFLNKVPSWSRRTLGRGYAVYGIQCKVEIQILLFKND